MQKTSSQRSQTSRAGTTTELALCLEYIENQLHNDCFRDFLEQQAADENDETPDPNRAFHTPRVPEQIVKIKFNDHTSLRLHDGVQDEEGVETPKGSKTIYEVMLIESSRGEHFDIQFGDACVAFNVDPECYTII